MEKRGKTLGQMLADGQAAADAGGIRCPACNCPDTSVYYTRKESGRIKRIRKCNHCGRPITTFESSA